MSKMAVVEGEFLSRGDHGKTIIELFSETFNLDDSIQTKEQARQLIRRGLLSERLSKKHAGFKSIRTCQIEDFKESAEEAENSELDKVMTKAIELQCVPVNIDNYKRPDYKIKALEKAILLAEERIAKEKKKKDLVEDQGYVD